jgi:hypothetical protein
MSSTPIVNSKGVTMELVEGVPPHVRSLALTLVDLDALGPAHVHHLAKKHKSDHFNDEETVFLKSGITLLTSAWEAYIEDLALGALTYLIRECKRPDDLPIDLKKHVARELKKDSHELSVWFVAGDNWREYCIKRFDHLAPQINKLNTPNSLNTKKLFDEVLGIKDITNCWTWEEWDPESVQKLIDSLVEIRCAVSHGRKPSRDLNFMLLRYFTLVVNQCAFLMNNFICDHLDSITGTKPWAYMRLNYDWSPFLKEEQDVDTKPQQ